MISVIVPVYNGAADNGIILRECLDSILAQKGVEFELIVVDDGSDDRTPAILEEYGRAHRCIRVIRQDNAGVSSARNRGVAECHGDYVCFVDADDCLMPGGLHLLREAIGESGIVVGKATGIVCEQVSASGKIVEYDGREFAARTLYQRGGHNSPWAMLVKRRLLLDEPFVENMRYEDLELSCRLYLRAGRVSVVDSPVYVYRENPHSFLNNWSEARTDAVKATELIEEYVADKCPELLSAARDRRLSANFNVFILSVLNGVCGPLPDSCWRLIKKYRWASLVNPRVRLKNKIGIMLSYCGQKPLLLAARLIMKKYD
ncbi:MAG: glycosyltransferase [Muribaculaceae bacterium]|nr:glycosyltransferase [Muribaculaceae bacterium]